MKYEDDQWIKALKKGSPDALDYFFQKYHHALYYHALDLIKLPALAEDVVQEVFVKVWENREQIKPELSFKSYLYTISKNLILNHLKRATLDFKAKQHFSNHHVTFHNQTEDQVVFADYEAMAQKAMERLPAKRKMVYSLYRLKGIKYDEIATQLNISKNTVRDHVVKAEKSIKEYFSYQSDIIISLVLAVATLLV